MQPYSHVQTQKGITYVTVLLAFVPAAVLAFFLFKLLGISSGEGGIAVVVIFSIILIIKSAGQLASTFTITVDDTSLAWSIYCPTIPQSWYMAHTEPRIPLADIVSADVVRTYFFFGRSFVFVSPRYGARAWRLPFTFDLLRIIKKDGTSILLGTDDPQGLLMAVRERVLGNQTDVPQASLMTNLVGARTKKPFTFLVLGRLIFVLIIIAIAAIFALIHHS